MCWFWKQKVKLHPNRQPTFLLLYAITNEKTVKLMQVDRLLSAPKLRLHQQKQVPITLVGIPYLSLMYLGYTTLWMWLGKFV